MLPLSACNPSGKDKRSSAFPYSLEKDVDRSKLVQETLQ